MLRPPCRGLSQKQHVVCVKALEDLVVLLLTAFLLLVNGQYLNVVHEVFVGQILNVEALVLNGACTDISDDIEVKGLVLISLVETSAGLPLVLGRACYEIGSRSLIAPCTFLIDDLLRALANSSGH